MAVAELDNGPCAMLSLPEAAMLQLAFNLDVACVDRSRALCRAMRHFFAADILWEPLCCHRWREKSKGAVKKFRESKCTMGWRQRFLAAEVDSRRSFLTSAEELHSLRFDFRFRAQPHLVHTRNFRFHTDGLVYGHPNPDLHYSWSIRRNGNYVRLGPFPPARVRRTKTWGWALCNPNVVCVSVDDDSNDDGDADDVVRRGAEPHEDAGLVRRNAELFERDSWRSDGLEEDAGASSDDDGGDQHRAVRLPDGRIMVLPAHVMHFQRRRGGYR